MWVPMMAEGLVENLAVLKVPLKAVVTSLDSHLA